MNKFKNVNKKQTFKRIISFLFKHFKWHLLVVALCLILSSIGGASASFFIQRIIDDVIYPGLNFGFDSVKSTLINLLSLMGTIYVIALISSTLQNQLMVIVTQKFLNKIRIEMFSNMQDLPISYFDQNLRGDIMSTYTNDVDTLRQLVSQTMPQLFSTVTMTVSILTLMLLSSIWLTIVVLLASIGIFFVSKKIGAGSSKYFMKQQKSIAKEEGFIEEMMHGQKVIKVFCHEEKSLEEFDKLNTQLFEDSTLANSYANILGPIIHNIGNILYVLVAIVGTVLYMNQVPNLTITGISALEIGIVVSFLTMSRQFANQFNQVSQQINTFVMSMAGANRVLELIDQPKEVDEGYVSLVYANIDENGNISESETRTGKWAWKHPHSDGTLTYTELKGDIQLLDVDFGYVEDKIVLHDVSVYANPGQKIALVGSTGAGKTTITNLITRFYDIADGKVRYDGININKIKKADLRRSIGVVLQDTSLFTGTVKENIKYGKLDATDEEVYQAAKIANAYDFITRLPNGFDTMLENDGANLSQGQRQLLSIARAAIADAPVLILDEATSSIDTRTELLVNKGMDQLMKGRTVFVIAHRLSTIQNADAIMVMEHGRIIERGTHDSLIEEKGVYYQLYTGAFELE